MRVVIRVIFIFNFYSFFYIDPLIRRNSSSFFSGVLTIIIYLIKKELGVYQRVPRNTFFEISNGYHPSRNWIHFDEDGFDDDTYFRRGQCLFFAEKLSQSIYGYNDMHVYIYFEKLPPGISPYTEESWPLIFKIFDLPTDYSVRLC